METILHLAGHLIVAVYTFVVSGLFNSHWIRGAVSLPREIGGWIGVATLLAGPWLALTMIGLGARRRLGNAPSIAVVSGAGLPMIGLYAIGMTTSWTDSARGAWTAATLDLAFAPVVATPVLTIAAGAVLVMVLLEKRRQP